MKPKPLCPYCGKKPEVESSLVGGYTVRCKQSFSHNVSVFGATPEEAIQLWEDGFRKRHFWEGKPK